MNTHIAAKVCSLSMLGVFLMSSCNPNANADAKKVIELQDQIEALTKAMQSQSATKEQTERRIQEVEKASIVLKVQLEEAQKDREEAQKDRTKLEEALRKLEGEFAEYKVKYKLSVQKRLPGYPVSDITLENTKYQQTEVRSIDGDSVSLSHSGGVVRVNKADLPANLRELLAIQQDTKAHSDALKLLDLIADRRKSQTEGGVVNKITPSAKVDSTTTPSTNRDAVAPDYDSNIMKSIATVSEGGDSIGSGFVARQGVGTYFFTNVHVVNGGKSLKAAFTGGQVINLPDQMDISDEPEAFDLVRFGVSLPRGMPVLELLKPTEEIKVGEKIMALGNSGGAGVVPFLPGHVKAFGAYRLEIDAEVIKGNSGGPVIRDGSSTVLGVVTTYEPPSSRDMGIQGTRFDSVRRICLRPDKIKKWRQTSLSRLVQEPGIIAQIELDTQVLKMLLHARFTRKGIEGVNTQALSDGGRSSMGAAIAAEIRRTNAYLDRGKMLVALPTCRDYCVKFMAAVGGIYGANVAGVDAEMFSRFNRPEFQAAAEKRKAVCNDINQRFAGEITNLWKWAPK